MNPARSLAAFLMLTTAPLALAAPEVRPAEFSLGTVNYRSSLVIPETGKPRAGIFLVPNWLGVTEDAITAAKRLAATGYLVYVADVYSENVRPKTPAEAGAAAGALRDDRPEMRKRTLGAYENFRALAAEWGVKKFAAIGFCFGGGAILEMARAGADARAFVSFHGDLASPTLAADSKNIRGSVLVLQGAADPMVPPADVAAFEAAMGKTKVDWQLVSFGGAVHGFTDPAADQPGTVMYDALASERAFAYMDLLFQKVL